MLFSCAPLFGQATNPGTTGAPGDDAHWASAAKNGFGTSNTLASKVWFTLTNGVMTEVFYPTLDVPNVQTLQLLIVKGRTVLTEADDTNHELVVVDPKALIFKQVNTARDDSFRITKTYVTDPTRSSVLIDITFQHREGRSCGCEIYVYYDPSLNNSGMHDSAWLNGAWLVASDKDKTSALAISGAGFDNVNNGFLGTTDGLTRLRSGQTAQPAQASNGNVVQTFRLKPVSGVLSPKQRFTVVLSFGHNPSEAIATGQASLRLGFERARSAYQRGWREYVDALNPVDPPYRKQFNMSAMVLNALEDKTYRGAMAASPSVPWGGGANANEPTVSGYHAVWARDLYQASTALYAMGNKAAANRALDYLFKFQQRPDGSVPQNSWMNGKPIGGGLQMDQVAFPLLLAYQLNRTGRRSWLKHVKPAAEFIVRNGPATEQERWEEEAGYSPATIAAEIAGLICAAHIAKINGDAVAAARYLRTADEWARKVEQWTVARTGPHAQQPYYLRITQGSPDANTRLEINSGGGIYDQKEIVDAGFLELVRLGIKRPDDPTIVASLGVVDKLIRLNTPHGPGWYRYNKDAYGEQPDGGNYNARSGKGRLWTLLTGERGEYELAAGDSNAARRRLETMMGFANDGFMIPEQVWDEGQSHKPGVSFGEGTGSATPLAWSMAQFIRLALNVRAGRNLETPAIVVAHFRQTPPGN